MKKNTFIILLCALLTLIVVAFFVGQKPAVPVLSTGDETIAVRTLIETFGRTLKNVSLLADHVVVTKAIQEQYGAYVAPALLAQWEANPAQAPGRLTSSPWPERILITALEKKNDTTYEIQGSVIEVTSEGGGIGESPSEALRRPVVMRVEKMTPGWRITALTLGAYPGDGGWIRSPSSAQGIDFLYPEKLATTFITPQEWPPEVERSAEAFSCNESAATPPQGVKTEKRTIGDRTYCVLVSLGGAAGSLYYTYDYGVVVGPSVTHVRFTLRFPQCMNYDEPNRGACMLEQSHFDIDGLVDRIVGSVRTTTGTP